MQGHPAATIVAWLLAAATALPTASIKIQQLPDLPRALDTASSTNLTEPREDPYAVQAKDVLASFTEYSRRLNETRKAAENQYRRVKEQEAYLAWNYSQEKQELQELLKNSTDEAAQAEASVLLERLDRLRADQVGIMDRSARYWQERSAEEKEQTQKLQAQIRLEQSLLNATALKESAAARQIKDITDAEKKHLDQWVDNLGEQVQAERAALYLEGRRSGMNQSELEEMLARPMKEIAEQAKAGPPQATAEAGLPPADPDLQDEGLSYVR